jgi:hypothetical protein
MSLGIAQEGVGTQRQLTARGKPVAAFDGRCLLSRLGATPDFHDGPQGLGYEALTIGSDRWDLFVCGVTRVGRDAFIQLTLIGPRECSVTLRAPSALVRGVTSRQILDAVCEWLISGDARSHAYIELPETSDRPF